MLSTEVLVVGGGLAGSLAALEAAAAGADTTMVLKGGPGRGARGNTAVAGGGFAVAVGHTDPGDSPDAHFEDTVRGGEFINDQQLVRTMVDEAPSRIRYLEDFGVEFDRVAGGYRQRQAPGHSHARSVTVAGGRMGQLGRVLMGKVDEKGVRVYRGLTLVDLLTDNGRVVGAVCLTEGCQRVDVRAGAVILATGGLGQLYPTTSNPSFMTGDGYAAAYRAGARLRDMEFVQFTPAGLVWPQGLRGFSISHDLLAHPQAMALNGRNEALGPLGPGTLYDLGFRLDLIRLFHSVIHSGMGTPHGGVYLDLRALPRETMAQLAPGLLEALLEEGIDPSQELLEVAPEVHFFVGGLDVDDRGRTNLPGLFAVGEVAGGCHGANRLTHNAFPEVIVFAPRAGRAAGEEARRAGYPSSGDLGVGGDWSWPAALDLRQRLREEMLAATGPIRTTGSLRRGLSNLSGLRAALHERRIEAASGSTGWACYSQPVSDVRAGNASRSASGGEQRQPLP